MARVLLADSQPLFNEALEALFSRDDAHQVIGRCSSAEDAATQVSNLRPDLVLIDAVLGLEGSPNLVARMLEACPQAKVIVLGDDHDADLLQAAIRAGAEDAFTHVSSLRLDLMLVDAALGLEGSPNLVTRMSPTACWSGWPAAWWPGTGRRTRRCRGCRPASARCSPCSAEAGTTPRSGGTCSSASTHIQNLLEKLGMHSKLEAATFATQRGMELELTPGGAGPDH